MTTNTREAAPMRRFLTTHAPSDTDGSSVSVYTDSLPLDPVLNGNAHIKNLFSTLGLPTGTPHHITPETIVASDTQRKGVTTPGGVNCQVTELAPNFKVDMHRSHSIDYNVFLQGSATLVTPKEGGEGEERREVKAGEVVVQCGTIHAWEAGPEGCRWVTVVVAAQPIQTAGGRELEEVDF